MGVIWVEIIGSDGVLRNCRLDPTRDYFTVLISNSGSLVHPLYHQYRSNHSRMCATLLIRLLGRLAIPCPDPGMRTITDSTFCSCSAV